MKKSFICLSLLGILASPALAALKINDAAPAFSLQDRQKKEFSLNQILAAERKENGNGVVISFFASWCLPCRNELPILNSLVEELNSRGIRIVIIGVREDFDKMGALLKELNVDKPIVLADIDGKVAGLYQVRFLPVTFFIGSDGKIKDTIFGEIKDQAEVRKSAAKLVK